MRFTVSLQFGGQNVLYHQLKYLDVRDVTAKEWNFSVKPSTRDWIDSKSKAANYELVTDCKTEEFMSSPTFVVRC